MERPKSISSLSTFFEFMRLSYAVLILLLALITPALCLDQETAEYWVHKGDLLFNLSNYYNESIEAYDRAIELNQSYAVAWSRKGNALHSLGKYGEAIQSYNKASSIDQTYRVSMTDLGSSHYNEGEYLAAIRYFDEAIKQDPKNEYVWYNKADTLRMLHRNSEAEAAYAKARELGYNGAMTLMEMTSK
jgi:tetratricopeptide (TPR) repeat protein